MISKGIHWFFFSVVLALLPLFLNLIISWVTDLTLEWRELVKGGELFFFSTAISGTSLGSLILERPSNLALTVLIGSVLIVILIMSSCLFALASFLKLKNIDAIEKNLYAQLSVWCSAGSIVLGYITFIIGEMP